MPSAERRRADAAKAQALTKAKPKPKTATKPPPRAKPPAAPAEVQYIDEAASLPAAVPENQVLEPMPFASMRDDPPFRHSSDRFRVHGPFELELAGGEIVQASWGSYTTTSGGWAWAWIVKDGRRLPFNVPTGWRIMP